MDLAATLVVGLTVPDNAVLKTAANGDVVAFSIGDTTYRVQAVIEAEYATGHEDLDGARLQDLGISYDYKSATIDAGGEPGSCIITGEPGENPDDCTTHGHVPGAEALA